MGKAGDGTVRFGIVGCGTIAGFHARALARIPGAVLVGAADAVPSAAEAFAAAHGVRSFASPDALFASPDVDVACLCTPSGLHAPLGLAAARAGKHLVVEKPVALSLADADALIAACAAADLRLAVISQLRFSPAVRQLKAAVDRGAFGRLVLADLAMEYHRSQEYYDLGGWRGTWAMDGGGALMNQGIHGVDLLLHLCGPVRSVSARTATLARRIEVEDTAVAAFDFANGAVGTLRAATSVWPGTPRRLAIRGDAGSAVLEEDRIALWDLKEPDGAPAPEVGRTGVGAANDPAAIGIEGHVRQLSDMADAVREGRAPLVDGTEGRKAVALVLACYRSSQEARPVLL